MRSNRSPVALAGNGAVSAPVGSDHAVPFEELYRDCAADAWRVARSVTGNDHDASDAVADAVTSLFHAVSAGRVAHVDAFRPYLLTATRNAAVDILRGSARVRPTGDPGPFDTMVLAAGPSERAVAADDCAFVARAFAELPPRWQSVLWLTEVEDLAPRDAAAALGITPNNVSQLAVRARARLRERYLQGHVAAGAAPGCRGTVERLGAFAAGRLTRRRKAAVAAHLESCPACRDRLGQLDDLGLVLRRATLAFPAALAGSGLAWPTRYWPGRRGARPPGPAPATTTGAAGPGSSLAQTGAAVAAQVDPAMVGLVQQLAGSPVVQAMVAATSAGLVVLGLAGAATHDQPTAAPAPGSVTVEMAEPVPTTTIPAVPAPLPPEPPTSLAPPAPPPVPSPPPAAARATPDLARATPDLARRPMVARTSTAAQAAVGLVGVSEVPGGPPSLALANPQPSGAPLVLLVQEDRGEWLNVLLPVRPNGSTGWVHRAEVDLVTHDYQIVVDLGAHRITVLQGAGVVLDEPIAVGTSDAPTPGGLYYTTALIQPADAAGSYDPGGPYGPYAYPLSGFSEVLFDFAGGDGQIGIHGTNDPSSLGGDVSLGCIRMSNAGITRLAGILPLGVPVEVVG